MSFVDKIIEQNSPSTETATETPAETVQTETQVETVTEQDPPPADDTDKPTETVEQPDEGQPEGKPSEEPPKENKPPKDYSQFSKEEKAEFAFRRQLDKQKTKYEEQIKKMHDDWQSQFDELKKTVESSKKSEPAKTRDDFSTDDEYIKYLASIQVNDIMRERDAQSAKEAKEREAQEVAKKAEMERQQEAASLFQTNCANCFTDQAQYAEFSKKVQRGLDNGLAELLDQVPDVKDYLFANPSGPLVLDEMLTNKDSFVRVMQAARNPTLCVIEMHEMAKEIASRAKAPAEPEQPKGMPHIGKPGSRNGGTGRVLGSDKDIINFVRSVH